MFVLIINAGSSSIKFSLFNASDLSRVFNGSIEGIGFETANFSVQSVDEANNFSRQLDATDHVGALRTFLEWAETAISKEDITAIGHRVVHGGPAYNQSCLIDNEVVAKLQELTIFDPEHLPAELELINELRAVFPGVRQIACFDTAFHHNLPTVARLLPIPRRFEADGLRRYGFHGLSYSYLLDELRRTCGETAANGRVILAHLGNGVSLAAVRDGQPLDTTMGLTPAGGVPMSTRSGDIDPGLAAYLASKHGVDSQQFNRLIGFESGLLGISETTSDMKKLLEIEPDDSRAADAVNLFCYQVKKCIGAYAAAMGGLDTVVFSGGMGEKAPKIRARICDGLQFLGVDIDDARNQANAELISADGARVGVHVLHTDEAVTIAREVTRLMENLNQ